LKILRPAGPKGARSSEVWGNARDWALDFALGGTFGGGGAMVSTRFRGAFLSSLSPLSVLAGEEEVLTGPAHFGLGTPKGQVSIFNGARQGKTPKQLVTV